MPSAFKSLSLISVIWRGIGPNALMLSKALAAFPCVQGALQSDAQWRAQAGVMILSMQPQSSTWGVPKLGAPL